MARRQEGQARAADGSSPLMAWRHSVLIESGVNIRRSSSTVTARPPQPLQVQKTPMDVPILVSGSWHLGQ
jgi:hypothetical protein